MPEPVASAMAFVANGNAYIFGGRTQSGKTTNALWEYNPITDAWTKLDTPPLMPRVNGVAYVVHDTVYLGLGYFRNGVASYTDSCYLRDFWQYIPATNTWNALPDYLDSYTNGCACYQIDNRLYIGAGYDFASYSTLFYCFDILTQAWGVAPQGPRPEFCVFGHCSEQVGERCFFGTGFRRYSSNSWYEYLPLSGEYVSRQSLPTKGRDCATATSTDEHIYVIGGQRFGGTLTTLHFYDDILRYSPADDTWTLCGHIPSGGTIKMVSFTIGNRVYFGLGEDQNGNIHNQLYYIEE